MPPPMDEPVPQAVMNDSFIIALGNTALQNKWIDAAKQDQPTASNALTPAQEKLLDPHDRNNWHVDGDFFYHFLDSPEQGLLPIVLFSDVNVGGGATMICPPAISVLAKHLYAHPEGVRPDMSLRNGEEHEQRGPKKFSHSFYDEVVSKIPKDEFVCATGKVGDVYLLHPFMVHSGTPNYLHGKSFQIIASIHAHHFRSTHTVHTEALAKPLLMLPLSARTTHHHESSRRSS